MHCRPSCNGSKGVAHMQHVKYNYIAAEHKADAFLNPNMKGQNSALPRHIEQHVTG
jgi:hypothetical protein